MKRQETEVVKIMRGTTEVSKIYRGTFLYYTNERPDVQLNYIGNGDSSVELNRRESVYFNTDFIPDSSTRIEIKYHVNFINTTLGTILGAADSNNTATYKYVLYVNNTNTVSGSMTTSALYFADNNKYGPAYTLTANTAHVLNFRYDGSKEYFTIDGSTQSRNLSKSYFKLNYPLYLFSNNNVGSNDNNCKSGVNLYYCKIWDNGTLVRNYTPVLHWYNSTYVPCLYDSVNDTYIYNLGTDTVSYSM